MQYKHIQNLVAGLALLGFDVRKTADSIRGIVPFLRDYRKLRQQTRQVDGGFPFVNIYPCLTDRYAQSGVAIGHYFHQDLLVARKVFHNAPERHVDVGSRIDGFVAHVAAFREIDVVDIRNLISSAKNIKFLRSDLMGELPGSLIGCCDSLSCLHALEHFGLGRYGDPIKIDGHLMGFRNLSRMVKTGGKLYLSVPIGPQRIEFNAHRVFSLGYLLDMVHGNYRLDSFSFVDDEGEIHENIPLGQEQIANNCGCVYGCGILELTKLS